MVNEMGFVYIGHWVESKTDASGDMAFVHPNFIDYFRSIALSRASWEHNGKE
jgi:hypothetical protein